VTVLSWNEDTVSFKGVIRRSGNSLIATIPPELSQRFLIKEGQEYTILGMTRMRPDFEGALQIYLGFFTVYEKAFRVDVEASGVGFADLERIFKSHGAGEVGEKPSTEGQIHVYAVFNTVEKDRVRPPKTRESLEGVLQKVKAEVEQLGGRMVGAEISEVLLENRQVDPAVLAKSSSRLEKNITWKWEL
jgi:hypothetical protein